MTIFLVATKDASEALGKELTSRFPDNVRRIADNQWLVSAKSTTQDFAESIDPDDGGKWGEWIVVTAGNYAGWHDLNTWEWIEQKRAEGRSG